MTVDTSTRWFPPEVASTRDVRWWLAEVLDAWHLHELTDDVLLCAVELATNAVLHVRQPFGGFARRTDAGIHVSIIDERPTLLPIVVPTTGSAVDLLQSSASGRGLQIVAALANRWGVSTSQHAKSVWFELTGDSGEDPSPPIIVQGHAEAEPPGLVELRFEGLPVRAAVASGIQVEELVRYVQLDHGLVDSPHRERLLHLLDVSAPARLSGRHAALRASAEGLLTFDLVLQVTPESLAATGELSRLLEELTRALPRDAAAIDDDVARFRDWLNREAARQLRGQPAQAFPGPTTFN